MINLFAASENINYAKCSRFAANARPCLKEQFEKNLHAILQVLGWSMSDLVIEQTLNAIKTRSGLTRRRGFEKNARDLWAMIEHHWNGHYIRLERDHDDCKEILQLV